MMKNIGNGRKHSLRDWTTAGNPGKPAEFTEEEKKTLTRALNDMGRQLMSVSIS